VLQKIEHVLGQAILSYIKYILLALEENAFLDHSQPRMGPSMESSPHQSEFPTGNPHRHHQKGEEAQLHTR
jgi:hypothetical protein